MDGSPHRLATAQLYPCLSFPMRRRTVQGRLSSPPSPPSPCLGCRHARPSCLLRNIILGKALVSWMVLQPGMVTATLAGSQLVPWPCSMAQNLQLGLQPSTEHLCSIGTLGTDAQVTVLSSLRRMSLDGSSLLLEGLQAADSGAYTCLARNSVGEDARLHTLSVLGERGQVLWGSARVTHPQQPRQPLCPLAQSPPPSREVPTTRR